MKTAQEPTTPAQIVRTTTTRQVLPANSLSSDQKAPEFWAYVASLENAPELWERHILYIYRITSESGPTLALEKCTRYLTMPDNSQVAVGNREEFEFALQKKYGGGTYRLILKKGSEWVGQERMRFEGAPKPIQIETTAPTIGMASESSATADVAKQAMHMVASHEAEAITVGVNALRGASEVIQRLASANTQQPSETDQLFRQVMLAMMQRAMNPPDPLEGLMKLAALQRELGGGGGSNGGIGSPLIQKFVDSAIERAMNPMPAGPVTSASAELVRQLPQIAGFAAEAIREWRIGSEAQRDTAFAMTGKQPPPAAALPPAGAPAPGTVMSPQPNPTAPPGGPVQMGAPSLEWIEAKIIEILNEPENTPDEAADDTIEFLGRMNPILLQQLAAAGEQGVLQIFQVRPNLRPALQNLPRLQEFIKAFFKYAAEAAEAQANAAGANGSVAALPVKPN